VKEKKDRPNSVLLFPIATRPAVKSDPPPSTVYFQIGSDRFAMHTWCESLPPAPLRRMSQVTSTEMDPMPLPGDRESRGPAPRPNTATKRKVGRNTKPSVIKPFPIQSNRATAARVPVPSVLGISPEVPMDSSKSKPVDTPEKLQALDDDLVMTFNRNVLVNQKDGESG
jgi:hypothetical protein